MQSEIEISHRPLKTTVKGLKRIILSHLEFSLARDAATATKRDWWLATAMAINSLFVERMMATQREQHAANCKRLYYFSLEFLMGRLLSNGFYSAGPGVHDRMIKALTELGQDYEELRNEEYDMGLGNGGLGRLAACFLDSLATLNLPAIGYGIHYQYGLFKQDFLNGYQVESPDDWMKYGTPWEIMRPEYRVDVELYGRVENVFDDFGNYKSHWVDTQNLLGLPYDIPVPGYGNKTVNYLRLWESRAQSGFDLDAFNRGGYEEAVRRKTASETISQVLYPNDKTEMGKELRFIQQYFFVTCSLHDIIRRYRKNNSDWESFPEKTAIQLNDTHPAIAVAELQRLLHDRYNLPWEKAWDIVTRTFAYTNHTLLPEALEKWSVALIEKVLPRHLQIIFEINKRHLDEVEKIWPGNVEKRKKLSLIEEEPQRMVRMAYLAVVGSHAVNGVAELHTRLLKSELFPDFNKMWPKKFQNKTNGITPRRWLLACNPRLSTLINSCIGDDWSYDLEKLKGLEPYANDKRFREEFMAVKRENKVSLAGIIKNECGILVDPDAIFDVQIKRIHEYKRQHLNLLHILTLYRRLLQNPTLDIVPRVFVFAGKAAPGYDLAKNIIKAINAVGEKINSDERIGGKLKVAFLPNYRVSLAQRIVPGADVSEQISTAGKEASGTGNMKLALNGAVTVGTLDGANVEILEEVGAENIFIFGMTVEEVTALCKRGYNPRDYYDSDEEIRAGIDWLGSNHFTPNESPGVLMPLHDNLLYSDPFLCLPDFRAYCDAQERVDAAFRDKERWAKMAILNTARMGKFSSDRAIREYAQDIWDLKPVKIK